MRKASLILLVSIPVIPAPAPSIAVPVPQTDASMDRAYARILRSAAKR